MVFSRQSGKIDVAAVKRNLNAFLSSVSRDVFKFPSATPDLTDSHRMCRSFATHRVDMNLLSHFHPESPRKETTLDVFRRPNVQTDILVLKGSQPFLLSEQKVGYDKNIAGKQFFHNLWSTGSIACCLPEIQIMFPPRLKTCKP